MSLPPPLYDPAALSPDNPSPLYMQLARHLRRLIAGGTLAADDALPAERDLAEGFAVSRVTVRKAVQALVDEGLLHQRPRAGTFVAKAPHVEQPLSALTGFSEDMRSRGLEPSSRWLSRSIAPASPEEAMVLGLALGERVSRLWRLRLADDVPMAIELSVVPARVLPDPMQVTGSLYDVLRGLGHPPHRALQRLSAGLLSADQAGILQVPEGTPALFIERRSFLENGRPLEFVRSQYRGDAYDFIVELNLSTGGSTPASETVT
ncbi:GntR family transcriptional regulator [Niveispirillum fermenti]|uniref:GntR family transcriptional regulator n=1 Tax=Niveispirillum fermenti TaxID=1233113 RepID=UPI003A84EEB1